MQRNEPVIRNPYIQFVIEFMNRQTVNEYGVFKIARTLQDCVAEDLRIFPAAAYNQMAVPRALCWKALHACEVASHSHKKRKTTLETLKADVIVHFQPFLQHVIVTQFGIYQDIMKMSDEDFAAVFSHHGPVKGPSGDKLATKREVAVAAAEGYGWGIVKSVASSYIEKRLSILEDGPLKTNITSLLIILNKVVSEMPRRAVSLFIANTEFLSGLNMNETKIEILFNEAIKPDPDKESTAIDNRMREMNETKKQVGSRSFTASMKAVDNEWLQEMIAKDLSYIKSLSTGYEGKHHGRPEVEFEVSLDEVLKRVDLAQPKTKRNSAPASLEADDLSQASDQGNASVTRASTFSNLFSPRNREVSKMKLVSPRFSGKK